MKDNASFIGRGWSFPPRFNASMNKLELVELEQEIRESLIILFSTRKGERITDPDFGCAVHDLILDPINPLTMQRIEDAIRDAIFHYEPRIDIVEISVTHEEFEGIVRAGLSYSIRKINVRTNMVFPFYKLEATDAIDQ